MQYTLRNIPSRLDEALRKRAHEEGKSLNEVAVETLLAGLGLAGERIKRRDLDDIARSWIEDPEIDEALEDQRRIDPERLDQVLDTGVPVEVERRGKVLKIIPPEPRSKLQNLKRRPYLLSDPEELVHLDWTGEWRP